MKLKQTLLLQLTTVKQADRHTSRQESRQTDRHSILGRISLTQSFRLWKRAFFVFFSHPSRGHTFNGDDRSTVVKPYCCCCCCWCRDDSPASWYSWPSMEVICVMAIGLRFAVLTATFSSFCFPQSSGPGGAVTMSTPADKEKGKWKSQGERAWQPGRRWKTMRKGGRMAGKQKRLLWQWF